jgi:hypothetical protein
MLKQKGSIETTSCNHQQIESDKLQGVIRNPFAFYFPIQRGFSGPVRTLPYTTPSFAGVIPYGG